MKTINFILVLFMTLMSQAKLSQPTDFPTKLKGFQMMAGMASHCSDSSWEKFSAWSQQVNLEQKTYSLKAVPQVSNGKFEFKAEKMTVSIAGGGGYKLTIVDQTFEGADACELVNKIPENLKTAHWFLNKFFPMAHAAPLINEPRAKETALLALSGILFGSCMVLTDAVMTIPCGMTLTPMFVENYLTVDTRDKFEKVINRPFKLFCSEKGISIEGQDKRINVDKSAAADYKVTVVPTKGAGLPVSDETAQRTKQGRTLAIDLAKKCNSPEDAATLTAEMNAKRETVKKRIIATMPPAKAAAPAGTANAPAMSSKR